MILKIKQGQIISRYDKELDSGDIVTNLEFVANGKKFYASMWDCPKDLPLEKKQDWELELSFRRVKNGFGYQATIEKILNNGSITK